jgi:NADPH-dependent 2,4-dienoyl-CoA reductase/sulfur reductase-like enzyme/ferredoxin
VKVVVDLTRCQGYAQCAFAAPDVFTMRGDEALLYDPAPDDAQRAKIVRAAAACPVQAIALEPSGRLAREGVRQPAGASTHVAAAGSEEAFKRTGHIVIVGASLAGLRAASVLRRDGFTGSLTVIGDEPYPPYDRPPLSKQVLIGQASARETALPRREDIDAHWRLGVAATGLDVGGKQVLLADGEKVGYDRVLIATGVRARPWPDEAEARLGGVFMVHTPDDADGLRQALAAGPGRVLVIGAGFTGCEVASACRELDIPVTVVERGPAPLAGALGAAIGGVAAQMLRDHGVDLRCGVQVTALDGEGNGDGRLRQARLSDGSTLDVDVAVAALGGIRNVEWLEGSGLAAGGWGIACDAGCRAFDLNGVVTDDVFVAGDVARFPHPVYDYQFLALEHWGNAVAQAEIAAHNMISAQGERWPHLALPEFWSTQFGTEIKSVGVPTHADQVVIAQGSVAERRFVAVYGYRGRITAAVAFNQAKWLESYERLVDRAAPFPPSSHAVDEPADRRPVAAGVPDRPTPHATVVVTGHEPSERRVAQVHRTYL